MQKKSLEITCYVAGAGAFGVFLRWLQDQLAFDEIYDMEFTVLRAKLAKMGIPVMKLESSYEYSREAMAPLTTRLESFVESIKEAK